MTLSIKKDQFLILQNLLMPFYDRTTMIFGLSERDNFILDLCDTGPYSAATPHFGIRGTLGTQPRAFHGVLTTLLAARAS